MTIRNMERKGQFPIIFAFGHQSRMGKDFCGDTIYTEYHWKYRIKRYKFATILKQVAHTLRLTPFPAEFYESERGSALRQEVPAGYNMAPVEVWTTLGPALRAYDKNIFVRPLMEQIRREAADIAIITDLRYPNEVEGLDALLNVWVAMIKVVCPDIKPLDSEADHALDGYKDWDYVLSACKGDLVGLKKQLLTITSQELEL